MGKYDEARKWLETALAMRPDDSRFHNSLGILYDSIGDNSRALTYYQSSIKKVNPNPKPSCTTRARSKR
jgi:Flp pilus assembly protein TadD